MANRDMKLDILVRLKDQMTGGLNRMTASLERVGSAARKIGAIGGIIAGISFMGPMQEAAAFQSQLLDIAATAELSGKDAFKFADEAKRKYEDMALHIGQTSHNIAEGAQIMIAAGLSPEEIDRSIEGIEKATTAANAAGGEMATLGTSLIQNLKLPADQVKDALGALMVAGKEGSFEMADMAREFPALTSGFANMGITGRAAVNSMGAFLEVVRKGTATSAEAATNLKNLVGEIQSPRVVKNFAKMGVDIQAVMKDAVAKGIDPLEAAIQKAGAVAGISGKEVSEYMAEAKAHGLTGAAAIKEVQDRLEKLGRAGGLAKIFGNQQSRDAVVAILANVEEFNRIKNKVAEARGEIIDKDAATKMQGFAVQLTTLGEIGTQAAREIGYAFNEWLPSVNGGLMFLLKGYRQIDEASGGFLKKVLSFGALATFAAVGIGALGLALPLLTAGFSALAAVVGLALSPIGLFIAALAGIGVLIYQNWDKAGPKLKKFWGDIQKDGLKALGGIKDAWSKLSPYMSQLWGRMSADAGRAWDKLAPYAESAWSGIKNSAASIFSGINWDSVGQGALAAYDATLRGLGATWDWLQRVWEGAKPYMEGIGQSLSRTFGTMGGVWQNIKGIASGLFDLAGAFAKLLGFGNDTSAFPEFLGGLLGFLGQLAALSLEAVAQSLQIISGAIRTLLDLLNGKTPDWKNYFPEWLVDYVKWLSDGLNNISDAFNRLTGNKAALSYMEPMKQSDLNESYRIASEGQKAFDREHPQNYDRLEGGAVSAMKSGGLPGLPMPQAVKVDNKAEMTVRVIGGQAQVSGNFNGAPIRNVSADAGRMLARP